MQKYDADPNTMYLDFGKDRLIIIISLPKSHVPTSSQANLIFPEAGEYIYGIQFHCFRVLVSLTVTYVEEISEVLKNRGTSMFTYFLKITGK